MTDQMTAAIVFEFGKPLVIEGADIPEVPDDGVLVHVKACGVCRTDLHAARGDWPLKPTLPFIPGHEGVGYVVATGKNVKDVKEGDRVGVSWLHTACGRCRYCLTGWETLCAAQQNTGYSVNGAFAEFALADPAYVAHLPDDMQFEAAAPILGAGLTAYKGLKETKTKPGDTVVISGIGGLGHLAVQYGKAMGLHIIAIDIWEDKLRLAEELGADMTFNTLEEDAVSHIRHQIGGADGVLVTADCRSAVHQALGMLRKGGTMSLVSLPPGSIELDIFDIVQNRKTVRGSIVGTRMDLIEALELANEGLVAARITTDQLENINAVFDRMEAGETTGRTVLTM